MRGEHVERHLRERHRPPARWRLRWPEPGLTPRRRDHLPIHANTAPQEVDPVDREAEHLPHP
jgi:hypothetical protein